MIPTMMYGTAWKEDSTEALTKLALESGFRAIDTANQRKHYFEQGVGNAVKKYLNNGVLSRKELFIQTKFTYVNGQDDRIPYDSKVDFPLQVRQSFNSSLQHLNVDYLDSYVLHGPAGQIGLMECDWKVWKEMEYIHQEGKIKHLGISNVNLKQLKELFMQVKVKPSFVQNRCYAQTGWDTEVRKFCLQNNIKYQGFSLLTANQFVLVDSRVQEIAQKLGKTPEQIIFSFAIQIGMIPITGTSSQIHMQQDLESIGLKLSNEELKYIEMICIEK
jgi:diketogulonate reductase-like aldo/keto reductase